MGRRVIGQDVIGLGDSSLVCFGWRFASFGCSMMGLLGSVGLGFAVTSRLGRRSDTFLGVWTIPGLFKTTRSCGALSMDSAQHGTCLCTFLSAMARDCSCHWRMAGLSRRCGCDWQ